MIESKISEANTGKIRTRRKGIKRSPESIAKSAAGLRKGSFFNCIICNKEFWRKPFDIAKGDCKFCTRQCYQSWQKGRERSDEFKQKCKGRTGDKNPKWKGGITDENAKIRASTEYKEWRNLVFNRDSYTCQDCGIKSGKGITAFLHAHHLQFFSSHPELRFELGNGITLCNDCHYKVHTNKERAAKIKSIYEKKEKTNYFVKLQYVVTFPCGEIKEIILGLTGFCKKHNLQQSSMTLVAQGKRDTHKGFKCEYYTNINE